MSRKYADVRIELTVAFTDNGKDDLRDQAIDALLDEISLPVGEADICVVGDVRDTRAPSQPARSTKGEDR